MGKLIKFIESNLSGKMVLALFLITNVLFVFMLTVTMSKTIEYAGGLKLLDLMFTGYDLNYVGQFLQALGENGRWYYLNRQIPVDMVYPALFGISYCLLIAYFLKKLNKLSSPYAYLCLLPFIAGISDYLENIGIIIMLNNYPDLPQVYVKTTNAFSILKSISMTAFVIILIIMILSFGFKKKKKKKSTTN
jgi:hypothetical protein